MAPLILALDQQLPSFKSQQTPPFPLNMYQIHPSRHAGPKHFQANLCSFPTNVDNSQHFHFIMAQKDMPSGQTGYAALLSCSAGRLPSPQVVRAALGAHFKILLCKFYYFYMINRKIPMLDKGTKYKQEFAN